MMWDIDQLKPLTATVVLYWAAPDDAVDRRKLGVNKEPQ